MLTGTIQQLLHLISTKAWDSAERLAYEACTSQREALAYLIYANLLLERGEMEGAAACISLGADIDEDILYLWRDNTAPGLLQQMSKRASLHLRNTLTQQHNLSTSGCDPLVQQSIWTRTHNKRFEFGVASQQPQLLYFPHLTASAWHNENTLDWTQLWRHEQEGVRAEAKNIIEQHESNSRCYIDQSNGNAEILSGLGAASNWKAIDIYRDGHAGNVEAPLINTLLKATPTYGLDQHPFECFLSILRPGARIAPHYGLTNHTLTVHIPISGTHPSSNMIVDGEARSWEYGKTFIFDDTFIHSAENKSNQNRVVLIFSVWHPELSQTQRSQIQSMISARKQWLDNRKIRQPA